MGVSLAFMRVLRMECYVVTEVGGCFQSRLMLWRGFMKLLLLRVWGLEELTLE